MRLIKQYIIDYFRVLAAVVGLQYITCLPHRPHFLFEAKFWNVFEFLGQIIWPAGLTDRMENLRQCSPRTFAWMCTAALTVSLINSTFVKI